MQASTLNKISDYRDEIARVCTEPYTADSDGGLPGQLTTFKYIAQNLQTYGGKTNFEDQLVQDLNRLNNGFETLIEKTKKLNEIFIDLVDKQSTTNK